MKTKPKRATRAARQCEGVDKGVFPVFADESVVGLLAVRRFRFTQPPVITFAKATRPSDDFHGGFAVR